MIHQPHSFEDNLAQYRHNEICENLKSLNSLLYVMYYAQDDEQSIYEKAPLMLVYELSNN